MSATLLSLEAARDEVARQITPPGIERRPLVEAIGQVLAADIRADRDIPAADRSSMDGYAFARLPAAVAPLKLEVVGEIQAGAAPACDAGPGECVRIFTGALLPAGTDTVVMQEDTETAGDIVELRALPARGSYVLKRGTDARAGDRLVAAGVRLSPLHVALAATAGLAELAVFRMSRVAILTTGEELREAGETLLPHQIRDSNRILVGAQLRSAGFDAPAAARAGDNEQQMAALAEQLLDSADVLVMIGGMSVGRYDFGPAALRRLGARIHFHRVQARPGKPQLFATRAGKLIFGLPGNPLSVLVGLHELVLPALRLLSGWPRAECRRIHRARLAGAVTGIPELVNFRPAVLRTTPTGPEAEVLAVPRSSADQVTAGAANGFVIVPPEAQLPAGAWVECHSWMEGA